MSVVALARVVRESLQEALDSTDRGILGGVQTWEEYQKLVGKRQGLQMAMNRLDDEVSRFDAQD
jgi:hypothetical protein